MPSEPVNDEARGNSRCPHCEHRFMWNRAERVQMPGSTGPYARCPACDCTVYQNAKGVRIEPSEEDKARCKHPSSCEAFYCSGDCFEEPASPTPLQTGEARCEAESSVGMARCDLPEGHAGMHFGWSKDKSFAVKWPLPHPGADPERAEGSCVCDPTGDAPPHPGCRIHDPASTPTGASARGNDPCGLCVHWRSKHGPNGCEVPGCAAGCTEFREPAPPDTGAKRPTDEDYGDPQAVELAPHAIVGHVEHEPVVPAGLLAAWKQAESALAVVEAERDEWKARADRQAEELKAAESFEENVLIEPRIKDERRQRVAAEDRAEQAKAQRDRAEAALREARGLTESALIEAEFKTSDPFASRDLIADKLRSVLAALPSEEEDPVPTSEEGT